MTPNLYLHEYGLWHHLHVYDIKNKIHINFERKTRGGEGTRNKHTNTTGCGDLNDIFLSSGDSKRGKWMELVKLIVTQN